MRAFPRAFKIALIFAALLHAGGLYVYQHQYEPDVIEIPFRTVNIRLGKPSPSTDGPHAITTRKKQEAHIAPVEKSADTKKTIKNKKPKIKPIPIKRPATTKPKKRKKPVAKKTPKIVKKATTKPKTVSKTKATKTRQAGKGEALGNKRLAKQHAIANYEQRLSLWLARHKAYPNQARKDGKEGRALIRLRIDRQGNITFFELIESTSHRILNDAILEMIEQSDPVPPIPVDYPGGDIVTFVIPVGFALRH